MSPIWAAYLAADSPVAPEAGGRLRDNLSKGRLLTMVAFKSFYLLVFEVESKLLNNASRKSSGAREFSPQSCGFPHRQMGGPRSPSMDVRADLSR